VDYEEGIVTSSANTAYNPVRVGWNSENNQLI